MCFAYAKSRAKTFCGESELQGNQYSVYVLLSVVTAFVYSASILALYYEAALSCARLYLVPAM